MKLLCIYTQFTAKYHYYICRYVSRLLFIYSKMLLLTSVTYRNTINSKITFMLSMLTFTSFQVVIVLIELILEIKALLKTLSKGRLKP